MAQLNLRSLFAHSALAPILRVAVPKLLIGTLAAVGSGLAMLAALWFLVQFIGHFSTENVLFSILFWIIAAILGACSSWIVHDAEAKFSAQLRRKTAQHLTQLPTSTLAKQGDQTLKRLLSDDIASLHHMVAHLPSEIAIFTVIPFVSICILVSAVGPAALLILIPGCLAALYYLVIVPHVSKRDGAARMQVMMDIIAKADDYVRGIRINRIYGQQTGALSSYSKATQDFTQNMVSWVAKVAIFAAIAVALLQAVATFAIAYWVAYQYDTVTLATALLFSLAVVTPALRLGHGLDYVATGKAAAQRLIDFLQFSPLDSGQQQQLSASSKPALDNNVSLEIMDASLALEDLDIFQHLNFQFPRNAITAITGTSGVGKSSLLRVIAGLENLKSGKILLDQLDLAQLSLDARHQYILYIPQGINVLDSTVRENLKLTCPDADDQELKKALFKAQLNVDLDTNAKLLSGGEKQRIGLARAFLSTAPVILLDEPTSALDHAHTTKLMLALHDLAVQADKTIVMVTHDQALAADMNTSLVLQGMGK